MFPEIQIIIMTNFIVVSSVGIKRVYYYKNKPGHNIYYNIACAPSEDSALSDQSVTLSVAKDKSVF